MTGAPLHGLLEHARRSTAYYARLLPPLDEPLPADVRALFAALPLLSRRDLQRRGAALRSVDLDPACCWIAHSSGSSGEPVEIVVDDGSRLAEGRALADYAERRRGDRRWADRDWFHLVLHPGASSRAMPAPWNADRSVIKWNLCQAWQASDDALLQSLAHLRGAVVTGMPSVFELLAARIVATGACAPQPALLLLSGESLSGSVRAAIGRAFDAPVAMTYALAETGVVATECAAAGEYHVETDTAIVEIVDADGRPVGDEEGELVATPLYLRSTPLLRHRTGDRAAWLRGACECGRSEPRFRLHESRKAARLVSADGVGVHAVRFAKLLATLGLERYAWRQDGDAIVLAFRAAAQLDRATRSIIEAAVHAALGCEPPLRFEPLTDERTPATGPDATIEWRKAEPVALPVERLATRLGERLAREPGVVAAAVIGSAVDPDAVTRFSDVDVVLLVCAEPHAVRWLELAIEWRRSFPGLQLAVDTAEGLSARAPLLACRLRSERLVVAGRIDESTVPWPGRDALQAQARLWGQETAAMLWQRLVSGFEREPDVVREAWLASKLVLQALRFRVLIDGGHDTRAATVVEVARRAPDLPDAWLADVATMRAVARERCPPPATATESARGYLLTALWIARCIACQAAAPRNAGSTRSTLAGTTGGPPGASCL